MNHFSKIKYSFLAVFLFLFLLTSHQTPHTVFAASGDICTGVYPTTGVSTPGACVTRSNCTGANILANSSCEDSTLVCCKGSVSTADACTGIYPTTGVSTSGACVALNNCTGANILANGSCGNSTLVCCKNGASTASVCAPPNSCVSGFACKDGASSAVGICASGSICCQPSNTPNTTATTNPSYNYTLLEKIPGVDSTNLNLAGYLSAVYKLAIWIVGLCALFMFLVGAFMYMLAAANTSKMGSAKSIMQDALIGLLLALTSYLILYVINPDLVNLRLPTVSMGGTPGSSAPVATSGAPTAGSGSGCGGLSVSGISNSQCNDASQPLSDVLACIHEKFPDAKITSISDSAGFDRCKNSWSKPPCAHAQTSCHYGGGSSQVSSQCNKSHAADFSVKNTSGGMDLSIIESLKRAGNACGGRVNDETAGPYPHIHISDQTTCCSL